MSVDTKTFNDIWVTGVGDRPTWRAFVQTPFREGAPAFSHDGRWMAYVSEQSGRSEIYMRPFPGPGEEWTISTDGGTEPVWARNAGQLFYRHGDEMMVVDVNMDQDVIDLTFGGGGSMTIPRKIVPGLGRASASTMETIVVSAAGDALSWPSLDVDVYVPGLVERAFGSRLFAAATGRRMCRRRSKAKAAVPKAHGANGGRPRKRLKA